MSVRCLLYLIFAVVMWCSLAITSSSLIACAVFLSLTFICYAVGLLKREEHKSSAMTGGSGAATAAGVVYRV